MTENPVIDAYSQHAGEYASPENEGSCWGRASRQLWPRLAVRPGHRTVADVGCGPGATLAHLAAEDRMGKRWIGIEPAEGLRERAREAAGGIDGIEVMDGRFESLPLEGRSIDYLYSIMAFHWVTDPAAGAREISRVLSAEGEADLFFIGRWNGREFIRATSPVFLRCMGPARLLEAAKLRQHLTREEAEAVFRAAALGRGVEVREWYETHHDTLEGHWAWWVRIEGQLMSIPPEKRDRCERDIRAALAALETPGGIPYTLHILHVRVAASSEE